MLDIIAVNDTYRHVPKVSSAGPLLSVGTSRLKWYDVARADTPVPMAVRESAKARLVADIENGTLGFDREVGFAILHRCGAGNDFYFLAPCTWRGSNELWESVYYRDATMTVFAPFPQNTMHKGTYCVWELGPVIHEQRAWVRFLQSARTQADLQAYLASTFEGAVGA
jgi:hypothetical protein